MNYNWDDMECNPDSGSFFSKRHLKHEKIDNNSSPRHDYYEEENDKENVRNNININLCSTEDIQNAKPEDSEPLVKTENESDNVKEPKHDQEPLSNISNNPKNIIQGPIHSLKKESFSLNKMIPTVYKYAQIYQQKKQENIQKIMNEDRKNRIFHAKAAPKHTSTGVPPKKLYELTMPKTPVVLKKSREFEEKRKKMAEENRVVIPKLTPRDARVVHEKPFKPDIKVKTTTNIEPFQLNVISRLEERKVYDDDYKRRMDERKKQKDELIKLETKKAIQEIRKNRTFKARPNPFK